MVMFVFSAKKIFTYFIQQMSKDARDEGSTTSGFQTFKIQDSDKKNEATEKEAKSALELLENCQAKINEAIDETVTGTKYAITATEKVEEAFENRDKILEEQKKLGPKTDANKKDHDDLEKKLREFMTKIQLGNEYYDYVGESKIHFGTTYKVLAGYGIHMKTNKSDEFRENIKSHKADYSCMGHFDSSKSGSGIERLKNGHYYVGKFEGGRRAGGAYIMDQSTKYVGEFRTESFNGFGCFYENGNYLFSKFAAQKYGPVKDKIQYPLLYITGNGSDIRYYAKPGEYYTFKGADEENILNKFKKIDIKGTFDSLTGFQEQYRNVENYVSENKIKLALGAVVVGLVAYKGLQKWWRNRQKNRQKSLGEAVDKEMRKVMSGESSSKEEKPPVIAAATSSTSAEKLVKLEPEQRFHSDNEVKESVGEASEATGSVQASTQASTFPVYYNPKMLKGKNKDKLLEIGEGLGLSKETWIKKTNKQIEAAIINAQRTAKRVQKSNRKTVSRRRSSSRSRR